MVGYSEVILERDLPSGEFEICGEFRITRETGHRRLAGTYSRNVGFYAGTTQPLEWSRVDHDRRTICIINAKSNAGDRVIPRNATVHMLLSALVKKSKLTFSISKQ
jgi:hypothetical protein